MKLLVRLVLALIVLAVGGVLAAPFLIPSDWIADKVAEQVRARSALCRQPSDTSVVFSQLADGCADVAGIERIDRQHSVAGDLRH